MVYSVLLYIYYRLVYFLYRIIFLYTCLYLIKEGFWITFQPLDTALPTDWAV